MPVVGATDLQFGCHDILIAVVDGLKGLADAIGTAYPRTAVQTCIVHLIRNSLDYASYKDRKALAAARRPVSAQQARRRSPRVPGGIRCPMIVQSWQRAWEHVTPFLAFPCGHMPSGVAYPEAVRGRRT